MSTQVNSTLVAKIYNSRNVLLEQLQSRGFDISSYEKFSISEMNIMMEKDQCDMLLTNEETGEKVYVKYYIKKKMIQSNNIIDTVEDLFNLDIKLDKETDSIIFITRKSPNDKVIKTVRQLYDSQRILVQVYDITRLQFNILNHSLVPEHIILDDEEKKELMIKYNVNRESELPEISRFDPVAIGLESDPVKYVKLLEIVLLLLQVITIVFVYNYI